MLCLLWHSLLSTTSGRTEAMWSQANRWGRFLIRNVFVGMPTKLSVMEDRHWIGHLLWPSSFSQIGLGWFSCVIYNLIRKFRGNLNRHEVIRDSNCWTASGGDSSGNSHCWIAVKSACLTATIEPLPAPATTRSIQATFPQIFRNASCDHPGQICLCYVHTTLWLASLHSTKNV